MLIKKYTEHQNRILRCTMRVNTQSIYRDVSSCFCFKQFYHKTTVAKNLNFSYQTRKKSLLINKYITTKQDEHLKYLQKYYNFISQTYTLKINVQIALKHELNQNWHEKCILKIRNKKFSYLKDFVGIIIPGRT